jgi:hypothetical protein
VHRCQRRHRKHRLLPPIIVRVKYLLSGKSGQR